MISYSPPNAALNVRITFSNIHYKVSIYALINSAAKGGTIAFPYALIKPTRDFPARGLPLSMR